MARSYEIGGRMGGYLNETAARAYMAPAGYVVETSSAPPGGSSQPPRSMHQFRLRRYRMPDSEKKKNPSGLLDRFD